MATWISIGNFADADTTEGNFTSENASVFLTTVDDTEMSLVESTAIDGNGDGIIWEDDLGGAETIVIDGVSSTLDSVQTYTAEIMLGDGSIQVTTVAISQLANGEAYIMPITEIDLDNLNIQSITMTAIVEDTYDGMSTGSAARSIDSVELVCFVKGALIEAERGMLPVEELQIGDLVNTLDHGPQPLRWIGKTTVIGSGAGASVRFAAGSFGENTPRRDLRVSQQHRILVRSKISERIFGEDEVLAAAKHLTGLPGVELIESQGPVSYYHLLFDCHEIVNSEGMLTESLLPGHQALKFVGPVARREIFQLFPELMQEGYIPKPARKIVRGEALQDLVRRHIKNDKVLVSRYA